jgi:hypothetical protein
MMKARLTLALALLLVCTGAALAQTPDGQPPSSETVCDNETGAAYGLCNAYCEAMDCETDNPSASDTACSRVRDKFQQITGRDLPCEVPTLACVCNDPAVSPNFAAAVAGTFPFDVCSNFSGGALLTTGSGNLVALSFIHDGQWACGPGNSEIFLPISPEEGQDCAELLRRTAASAGVTCTP